MEALNLRCLVCSVCKFISGSIWNLDVPFFFLCVYFVVVVVYETQNVGGFGKDLSLSEAI